MTKNLPTVRTKTEVPARSYKTKLEAYNAAKNILKIALSGREEEPVDTCATKAH